MNKLWIFLFSEWILGSRGVTGDIFFVRKSISNHRRACSMRSVPKYRFAWIERTFRFGMYNQSSAHATRMTHISLSFTLNSHLNTDWARQRWIYWMLFDVGKGHLWMGHIVRVVHHVHHQQLQSESGELNSLSTFKIVHFNL